MPNPASVRLYRSALYLCVSGLAACGSQAPKPSPKPASIEVKKPLPTASTQAASASAPAPSLQDITQRELKELSPAPFAIKTIAEGKPVFSGESLQVMNGSSTPPRLLVGVFEKAADSPKEYRLLDPTSGAKLATFQEFSLVSEKAGVFIAYEAGKNFLVRLSDGTSPTLQAILPDGTAAEDPEIFLNKVGADIWVFAQDAAKRDYYAQWKNLAEPKLPLSPFPFTPNYSVPNQATHSIELAPKLPLATQACAKVRMIADQEPLCLFTPSDIRSDQRSDYPPAWVDSYDSVGADYLFLDSTYRNNGLDRALSTISTKERVSLPGKFDPCSWTPYAVLAAPPRVLGTSISCKDKDKTKEFIFLWSPEKTYLWSAEQGWNHNRSWGSQDKPMLPATGIQELATTWVDLERGVVFTTPPLVLPDMGSQERLTLALSPVGGKIPAMANELVLLDFEAGTLSVVGALDGCKGEIYTLQQKGDRQVIACMTSKAKGFFPSLVQWIELIDLKTKTRYQTKLAIEWLFDDGAVSLSNRKESGEGHNTATQIYYLPAL